MRKILILAAAVLFLAAACNQQTASTTDVESTTKTPNPPVTQTQTVSGSRVDAVVTGLNASVDSEDAINTKSDSDIVDSDQSLINSYNGVSNASSF